MTIQGIILAAGFSSRAGAFKMELPFGQKKLLEIAIETMTKSCSGIFVVAGYLPERIKKITQSYPYVRVVVNEHFQRGMFSSVLEGVRHLESDAFFITPGDYPFITPHVYQSLTNALETSASGTDIFIPTYNGRKGHPVLMKKTMVKKILDESVDSMLKTVINRNVFELVEVGEEGILMDVDTPEDYEKAKIRLQR